MPWLGFVGRAEEGNLVASPAASLRPTAVRCALCAGGFLYGLKPVPIWAWWGGRVEGVGGVEGVGVLRLRSE